MNRTARNYAIVFLGIVLCSQAAVAGALPGRSTAPAGWQQQYDELSDQINAARQLQKLSGMNSDGNVCDPQGIILPTDRDPLDVVLRRTEWLLDNLKNKLSPRNAQSFRQQLNAIKIAGVNRTGTAKISNAEGAARQDMFFKASALQRQLALTNPLLPDTILFSTRATAAAQPRNQVNHICDQFEGFNASLRGSIYLMTNYKSGGAPTLIDLLANSIVQNGRLQGKSLKGGGFLSPDLSYDGKSIVFAWVATSGSAEYSGNKTLGWAPDQCFHIFKVNSDGSNLVQLTDGAYNDFQPCWLPNGRIVFISERRDCFGRCFYWTMPTYTMYSMKTDGSDMICLSYHETNEWAPSVDNDGMIVYSRWDYIDRDDCIAHNFWICYPDGRNPRAPSGNYPTPLSTLTGSGWADGRILHPMTMMYIRAIPNSVKYVAIGTGHHSQSYGDIIVIDPTIRDDNKLSQITDLTNPGRTTWCDCSPDAWVTPWPLSEDYFLAGKNGNLSLFDRSGTETSLIWMDYNATGNPQYPIPFRPRTKPNSISMQTWQGERASLPDHKMATISIMNALYSDLPLPQGTKITALRIMQVVPKTTPAINTPRPGYAAESLVRLSLGTVPIESDGSAYFEAPVGKEIYFQLLDDKGMAVQSMRSGTYAHAGEQMTCYGCHEDKWTATPPLGSRIALNRAPSRLRPEAGAEPSGITPINFYRLVKPVFNAKCVSCHQQQAKGPDMSYNSLKNYAFFWPSDKADFTNGDIISPIRGGSRTIPGSFGARYASLPTYCQSTHYGVSLTADEMSRVNLWLDANSNELGAYTNVDKQQQGLFVLPELDVDAANPTGVEQQYPTPIREISTNHTGQSFTAFYRMTPSGATITVRFPDAKFGREATPVRIDIIDLRGRLAQTVAGTLFAGSPQFSVDAHDRQGHRLQSGQYLVRIRASGIEQTLSLCVPQ